MIIVAYQSRRAKATQRGAAAPHPHLRWRGRLQALLNGGSELNIRNMRGMSMTSPADRSGAGG